MTIESANMHRHDGGPPLTLSPSSLSWVPAGDLTLSRYTLRVLSSFEAAHHLTSYGGTPEPIHGHSWRVEAVLTTETLGDEGMAYDFVVIKNQLDELAGRFHHRHINEVPPFDAVSPTTERIASWFFTELVERLPDAPWTSVTVWEGPLCSATYSP